MNTDNHSIAVLGTGSWGTALAILFAKNGETTALWGRDETHINEMQANSSNARYLPDIPFPEQLRPVSQLESTLSSARDILLVVPSHAFPEMLLKIKPFLKPQHRLMWATKGFEPGTGKLLHEVVNQVLGTDIESAVISGPTFAREVAMRLPTAVTVASASQAFANEIAGRLHNDVFRAYISLDVSGVEIGGAVKNVLAVAAGIADGLGFGANARAALITRGLHEMMLLGVALGGERDTFMGLTGLGDLVLTCTDNQSRNRRFGLALGKGESIEKAIASIGQVVEGMKTTREVKEIAERNNVEMPITEEVYSVLYEGRHPKDAVHSLLMRRQKME